MTPDNVFEDICSSFEELPRACVAWYVQEKIPLPKGATRGVNRQTLIMILAVLTLVSMVVIMVYRNWIQAELQKDMKIQVSSAVS